MNQLEDQIQALQLTINVLNKDKEIAWSIEERRRIETQIKELESNIKGLLRQKGDI